MLNGVKLPTLPTDIADKRTPCPLKNYKLERRSYGPSAVDVGWQAPLAARAEPRPSFYLLDAGGCNSSETRRVMRAVLDGRPMQKVLPIVWSQYLADLAIVDEIEKHPLRTMDPAQAGWHIVAAAPVTSELLATLGLLGGQPQHEARMEKLGHCLRNNRRTRGGPGTLGKPLYINIPSLNLHGTVGTSVMQELVNYDTGVQCYFVHITTHLHTAHLALSLHALCPSV